MQQRTQEPVQFEITEQKRGTRWLSGSSGRVSQRTTSVPQPLSRLTAYQDASVCADREWPGTEIALHASDYSTHSLRRTKVSLIYFRTKNLRAIQLLLGHTKLERTVRHLGVEVDDALEVAEQGRFNGNVRSHSPGGAACLWQVSPATKPNRALETPNCRSVNELSIYPTVPPLAPYRG